jgi:predicted nucleotidyltransferase
MPSTTPSRFTTFASCRFIDRSGVLQDLRDAASHLRSTYPSILSVTLFGSFAVGVPTPRSDADILVEVEGSLTRAQRREAAARHADHFHSVSVPVELFVCSSAELVAGIKTGRGIAATAGRTGIRPA